MIIDTDALRKDLMDYFGTALSTNKIAMAELIKVTSCSCEELIYVAKRYGINLSYYEIEDRPKRR